MQQIFLSPRIKEKLDLAKWSDTKINPDISAFILITSAVSRFLGKTDFKFQSKINNQPFKATSVFKVNATVDSIMNKIDVIAIT